MLFYQTNPGPGNTIPTPMSTTGTQGGILMSQTNTTAMGGAQITQSVVSSNAPQMNMQVSVLVCEFLNSKITCFEILN